MNFNNTLSSHSGWSSQLSVTYSTSVITCQMLTVDLQRWVTPEQVGDNSMTLFVPDK